MGKFTLGKDTGFLQRMFGKSYTPQQVDKYEQDRGVDYERSFGFLDTEMVSALQKKEPPRTFQGTTEDWTEFREDFLDKRANSPFKFSVSAAETILGRDTVRDRLKGIPGLGAEYFTTGDDVSKGRLKRFDPENSNNYKDENGDDRHDVGVRTTQIDGNGNPVAARTNNLTTGDNEADNPESTIGGIDNAQRDAMFHNIALELANDSGGRVSYGPSALERNLIEDQMRAITSGNREESIARTNELAAQFKELGISVNDVDNPTKNKGANAGEGTTEVATADGITTIGNLGNSPAQNWNQVAGTSFEEKLAALAAGDNVIEVDENKFKKVDENEKYKYGDSLITQLKVAKSLQVDSGLRIDGKYDPYFFAGADRNKKSFAGPRLNQSIEENFTKEQWDSLDEGQKQEAFALIGETALNNTQGLQDRKLNSVIKPKDLKGLSANEARLAISNNRNYKDFFKGAQGQKNINAILKNEVVAEDFRNLNSQEFANKYSTNGKLDETKIIGNNFSKESKEVLNKTVSTAQIKEFEKAVESGDQAAIDEVLSKINLTEEQEKLLVKTVRDTGGDFRQSVAGANGRNNLRALYITTIASISKDSFQYANLTQKDTYKNLIEGGMLNDFGLNAAEKQLELQKSILESSQEDLDFSKPYKNTLTEINKIKLDSALEEDSTVKDYQDYFNVMSPRINDLKDKINNKQDAKDYQQQIIELMKRFSAEQNPNFWKKVFSLNFARGGNAELFDNSIDIKAKINEDNGKVDGLIIGDVVLTVKDLRGQGLSNSFINILVAAGENNQNSSNRRKP